MVIMQHKVLHDATKKDNPVSSLVCPDSIKWQTEHGGRCIQESHHLRGKRCSAFWWCNSGWSRYRWQQGFRFCADASSHQINPNQAADQSSSLFRVIRGDTTRQNNPVFHDFVCCPSLLSSSHLAAFTDSTDLAKQWMGGVVVSTAFRWGHFTLTCVNLCIQTKPAVSLPFISTPNIRYSPWGAGDGSCSQVLADIRTTPPIPLHHSRPPAVRLH